MHTASLYVQKLSYGARPSLKIQSLSFSLRQGQCLALTGANGSGKSTLLHILSGLIRPCQGQVLIQGVDIHQEGLAAKHYLGLLPEKLPLYPDFSVDEFLKFVAALRLPLQRQTEAVTQAIQDLRLGAYRSVPIRQLSRGLQQRVGIAQAILHRPPVLLLDEPTNGLDPFEVQHFQSLLEHLKKETAIILSTHYFQEAQELCDQQLTLSHQGIAHVLHPCTA